VNFVDNEIFSKLLVTGELTILVDRLFFPHKSSLVSAYFVITHKNRKIGSRDFISTIALLYRKPFNLELCRVLTICKVIEYIVQKKKIKQLIHIRITSDYAAVINFLHQLRSTISNKAILHQIKREILLIKEKINLQITPFKVTGYQDKLIPFNKLSFLEKVNTICNQKVKSLIRSETRETIPFPFVLSSLYILINNKIISQHHELEQQISISMM